jgi:hypothetical protein
VAGFVLKSPGMRDDYGGTDLLENADFPSP